MLSNGKQLSQVSYLLKILFLLSFSSFYSFAEEAQEQKIKPTESVNSNTSPLISYDTGYLVKESLINLSFFHYDLTRQLFIPTQTLNSKKFSPNNSALLNEMTDKLEKYVLNEKNGKLSQCTNNQCSNQFLQLNGVTEREMANEVIVSSFCFGTDPFIEASKVRQESKFDIRSVSPTGAIGLTQITGIGLKEILDQFGHRGAKYSSLELKNFIFEAIDCYTGEQKDKVMANFPAINTFVSGQRRSLEYTADTIANLKRWISVKPNQTTEERAILVKRQLILGQTLLKIYLAFSYGTSTNKQTFFVYERALRMFNGDRIKVKYAKEVLKKSIFLNPL
ncbi:MAG: hypothetical protein HUU56_01405 [Bdellovibrionaceae bacterium]|nr:hypothetical protein [Pseudobdellovibrionaceae bacterium]